MGDLVNLVAILAEKERQKEAAEAQEKAELREQLQWILNKMHEKSIPYKAEDEYDEPTLRGGWFSRLFNRDSDD